MSDFVRPWDLMCQLGSSLLFHGTWSDSRQVLLVHVRQDTIESLSIHRFPLSILQQALMILENDLVSSIDRRCREPQCVMLA